jgi:hypothetical protein
VRLVTDTGVLTAPDLRVRIELVAAPVTVEREATSA